MTKVFFSRFRGYGDIERHRRIYALEKQTDWKMRFSPSEQLMIVDRTSVSLCVYGDDLDPDELTHFIGHEPTHGHRKGELRPGPLSKSEGGQRTMVPWHNGAWILQCEGIAPVGPEEITMKLLERLPSDEGFWEGLSRRYELRFSYGIHMEGNQGFRLTAKLQRLLRTCKADLDFDIYSY